MASSITIEFCTEDRARLDNLQSALTALVALAMESPSVTTAKACEEFSRGFTEGMEQAISEPTEPEMPKATLADIQALVQKLVASHPSARDKVKQIVNTYSERVSTIPEDKFDEAMKRLTELGKELEGKR